jgi:AcrR family transcriptional regulator
MNPAPEDEARPAPEEAGLKVRLAATARHLLERDGLDALTLRAAAREAGVSHMAPYRHFKDKAALLAAVAAQGFRELTQCMDRAADAKGDVRAYGAAYVGFALANPALYKLMSGAGLVSTERPPELIAAGADAFHRCLIVSRAGAVPSDATHPGSLEGDRDGNGETPAAAIAFWAIVHGLASLAIDGLVALPPEGPARDARIAAILKAVTPAPP